MNLKGIRSSLEKHRLMAMGVSVASRRAEGQAALSLLLANLRTASWVLPSTGKDFLLLLLSPMAKQNKNQEYDL